MLPSGQVFTKADFQDLLDKRGSSEICMGHHLKQKQLSAKGQERQNVGHSMNLISRATADMVDHFYPDNPRKLEIGECVRVMAEMHQVMTSHDWEEKTDPLKSPFANPIKLAKVQLSGKRGNSSSLLRPFFFKRRTCGWASFLLCQTIEEEKE